MDCEECVGEGGVSGTLLPPLRAGCSVLGTEGLRCRCRAASGPSALLAAASLGCRARSSEPDSDSSGVLGRGPPGCASASSCRRPPADAMQQHTQRLPSGCRLHTDVVSQGGLPAGRVLVHIVIWSDDASSGANSKVWAPPVTLGMRRLAVDSSSAAEELDLEPDLPRARGVPVRCRLGGGPLEPCLSRRPLQHGHLTHLRQLCGKSKLRPVHEGEGFCSAMLNSSV